MEEFKENPDFQIIDVVLPSDEARPPSCDSSRFPFNVIFDDAIVGLYFIQDEHYVYVNDAYARLCGVSTAQFSRANYLDLLQRAPHVKEQLLKLYRMRIEGRCRGMRLISGGINVNGRDVKIERHSWRVVWNGRPAVVGIGLDATDRLERERKLRESRAQLQELAAQVNELLERQRAHISRELHDVVGAYLTSMKMDLTRLARRTTTPELADIAGDLMELAQQAVNEVRRIANELRPSVLDHLGLAAAMEREVTQFATRNGIQCHFECPEPNLAIPTRIAINIYRVLQESLTNVARHARAQTVLVRFGRDADLLSLEVIDDGQGFVSGQAPGTTLGILGMRERARSLGGTFDIGPNDPHGIRLHLVVPLAGETGDAPPGTADQEASSSLSRSIEQTPRTEGAGSN
jgi:two-component system sensor histidine kinase UhpB